MSLTQKVFDRFWATMGERYGSRWLDTYGATPTHAWRETLQAFSPRDIHRAIDLLSVREETKQHPPTEPGFKALLLQAARTHARPSEDPAEFRRGYWRSTIIAAVADGLGYRFGGGADTFEAVLIANKHSLGLAMKRLLDEVDELELTTGQRTAGMESMVAARCREIVTAFTALKAQSAAPKTAQVAA